MKKIYFVAMLFAICFVSCGEKEEGPEVLPDDVMFVKVKIDGKDYEYSYKLKDNYLDQEGGPNFQNIIPNQGVNIIVLQNTNILIDIQRGCDFLAGKNACLIINIVVNNPKGINTNVSFFGLLPGVEPQVISKPYNFNGDNSLPFEVTLSRYDPIKLTIDGVFKGKAKMSLIGPSDEKIIEVEGSFRAGAIVE